MLPESFFSPWKYFLIYSKSSGQHSILICFFLYIASRLQLMLLPAELINKNEEMFQTLPHIYGSPRWKYLDCLEEMYLFFTVSENSPEAYNQQAKGRASKGIVHMKVTAMNFCLSISRGMVYLPISQLLNLQFIDYCTVICIVFCF